MSLFPVALYEKGYLDLISVIPPNATLAAGSSITASALGKAPGRRLGNGTWAGYNWRAHAATWDDVQRWAEQGANIGLRSKHFPGLDIDSLDESVATTVEELALKLLGHAPVRIGRPPKRLLMYRTDKPFPRMRLILKGPDGVSHLIELLCDGQQYLVHGTHPVTKLPYTWSVEVGPAAELTAITQEQVAGFFELVAAHFKAQGFTVDVGGNAAQRQTVPQAELKAPSIAELAKAVAVIPNDDNVAPTREDYIRMGYAIKAASGDEEGGFDIFAEWAGRHAADDRVSGNPETWRSDWRRMAGPFSVGWDYIRSLARGHGYNDAANDFDAPQAAPAAPAAPVVQLSDSDLANRCVAALGHQLRYVPLTGKWLLWDGRRWAPDTTLHAQYNVRMALQAIAAAELAKAGPKMIKEANAEARRIESEHTIAAVIRLMRSDPSIALEPNALDADPWLLNTPSGAVDLRTGVVTPAQPEQLSTKLTATGPNRGGACPEWKRFLAEATGGDAELEAYLQRLAGYCCTGSTREQTFTFIAGLAGTGKSTYLNTVRDILGDYGAVATMDTFHANNFDKHSTDLADLMGSRMVTASETQKGRRWDEQKIKLLTGGEPIKARFMRQDNFTFNPAFKLVFSGNDQPTVSEMDDAIRRRVHMVTFNIKPAKLDLDLKQKLREEFPAILGWMLEGCLSWQQQGLNPPRHVQEATIDYVEAQDATGRWLEECCVKEGSSAFTESGALYQSWREWCGETGEYIGTMRVFVQALRKRGFEPAKHPGNRRGGFRGLKLKEEVRFP